MAILFEHTGEGAADEQDLVSGALGHGTPFIFIVKTGSPVVKYDTARSHSGTISWRLNRPTAADNAYCRADLAAPITRMQIRHYVWMSALPTSQLNLFAVRNSSGFMGYLGFASTGKLSAYNATNSPINASVASATFPLSQWVRIEAVFKAGLTTADGIIEYAYYLGDSTTAVSEWSQAATSGTVGAWAATNTGTTDPFSVRLGINGITAVPDTIWNDDFAIGDASSGWIGPTTVSTPDAIVTSTLTRLIDARGSTVGAGTLSYGISQTGGTTTTPALITAGCWSVIPHATSTLTYEITATGSLGGSDTAIATVPPVSSGTAAVVRLVRTGGVFV